MFSRGKVTREPEKLPKATTQEAKGSDLCTGLAVLAAVISFP